ncbi:Conserved hypothetical protein [Herminiimonas arsenicoxydans]|uniref:Uncharacterized protein n=1 Tax=Herminiimonas arsenicoxydans TaxID=204773 RepID=A4G5Y6_HERAR|nr:Conserved hypothetical protein [Herminiimonas arsenicoxydans]
MMKLIARMFAAALMLLSGPYVWAQTTATMDEAGLQSYSVQDVVGRYPAGAIKTQETADSALEDVKQARANIEARFNAEQHACYPKFFATSCLNKAKERRRVDLLTVKPIEVEANAYIRHARVVERDRRLTEKAAENEGKAILQQAPGEGKTDDAGKSIHEQNSVSRDAQRKARADAQAKKNEKQAEKQQSLKANEAAEEQKRAANIRRYEEKVKESAARQKEILEKKAEKEKAQQQK